MQHHENGSKYANINKLSSIMKNKTENLGSTQRKRAWTRLTVSSCGLSARFIALTIVLVKDIIFSENFRYENWKVTFWIICKKIKDSFIKMIIVYVKYVFIENFSMGYSHLAQFNDMLNNFVS